jgi:hypothetical protein
MTVLACDIHNETMLSFDVLLMDAEKTKDVESANGIL